MAVVIADKSCNIPTVPFEWESSPGIPKFQQQTNHEPPSPSSSFNSTSFTLRSPSKELQTQWVQSMNLSSNSKNHLSSSLTRLRLYWGHIWSRLMKWRNQRKLTKPQLKLKLELDPAYLNKDNTFCLEKLARWSMPSSRRESSSSFSSRLQSSYPDQSTFSNDDEAAQFRLIRSLLGILRTPKMIGMESEGREKKEINISVYVVNS